MVLKKGFTLVEILIVMTIVLILMMIMIGILNPISLINRAQDSQRKKEIRQIKIAFEEYFNDKRCYPVQAMVDSLNCQQDDFVPWLAKWPCDPDGSKYKIFMENTDCPLSYKILTNLKNKNDVDIPKDWYASAMPYHYGDGTQTRDDVNFGVSSTETIWNAVVLSPVCNTGLDECYRKGSGGNCQAIMGGQNQQQRYAYTHNNCLDECLVDCCYNGDVCIQ